MEVSERPVASVSKTEPYKVVYESTVLFLHLSRFFLCHTHKLILADFENIMVVGPSSSYRVHGLPTISCKPVCSTWF